MSPEAATLPAPTLPRRRAVVFIILLGTISLFADMAYEGARSINGPYLGLLGFPQRRSASFPALASSSVMLSGLVRDTSPISAAATGRSRSLAIC
jgi:hypothetical protein